MESSHQTRPLAPWVGGKRHLASRIIERIEATPHTLYAEPFVGMGGVFLRRPNRARTEVINDFSRDVVTLFRILQRHFPQFLDVLKWQITSRAEFQRLLAVDPATLTDLERAARFLYLQRAAFGGKVAGRTFGVTRTGPARFDLAKLVPLLESVHERLSSVVIECLHFEAFIRRYDGPGALFYLDPPYWGCEDIYNDGSPLFERADFERLATVLSGLKGQFLMSINDRPEIRSIFGAFAIEEVKTTYTLSASQNHKAMTELLISRAL